MLEVPKEIPWEWGKPTLEKRGGVEDIKENTRSRIDAIWEYWQLIVLAPLILYILWGGFIRLIDMSTWWDLVEFISRSPMTLRAKIVCNGNEVYIKRTKESIVCYVADDKKKVKLESWGITIPEVTIKGYEILRERTIGKGKVFETDNWWDRDISVIGRSGGVIFTWRYRDYLTTLKVK